MGVFFVCFAEYIAAPADINEIVICLKRGCAVLKKENSFIKAGAILAVSGFVVKLLSAAYRIPLTRMMGASLMGHYSAVLNVFMPFFSVATAGITPALSRFTAQLNSQGDDNGIYRLSRRALRLYISIAAVTSCFYLVFSKIYAQYIGENIFFTGAVVLLPCIVMAAAEMVFKGITQGKMDMLITAKANVAEGMVKTVLGIVLVYWALYTAQTANHNLPVMACLTAMTISSFMCFIYLVYAGRVKNTGDKRGSAISAIQLLSMSVPIAASALTVSLVNFFDTAVCLPLIKNLPYGEIVNSFRGASFMGADEISMYLFGIWQGIALTVFNLVPAVLASVGTACLPVMTKAQGLKDKTGLNRQSEKLFRITAFISVPAAAFIFLFRSEIIMFLFGITQRQARIGAELLATVIPFCPLACFVSAYNSVIHAHGKSAAVFKILAAASAAKCTVSAIGCSLPQVNIRAMAMSTAVFYTIIFVMSAIYISKLGVRIHFYRIFALPLAASALTALALNIFRHKILFCLPIFLQLLFGGVVFCTAYVLMMFVMGFTVDI